MIEWLTQLHKELRTDRKSNMPRKTNYRLRKYLDIIDFDRELAREWILRGSWQFKGANAKLELADFFPTKEQLDSLKLNYWGKEKVEEIIEIIRELRAKNEKLGKELLEANDEIVKYTRMSDSELAEIKSKAFAEIKSAFSFDGAKGEYLKQRKKLEDEIDYWKKQYRDIKKSIRIGKIDDET